MKLHVGERLHGTGPAHQPGGYLVTDIVRETPWYGLYAGKKVLYNFDFTGQRVRETDDREWLDVYLRTIRYPRLDDAADVAQRRALARTEVQILGNRASNLWPEPIDLLETDNNRDAFTFPPTEQDTEPIVVFARPHGQPLGDWQQSAMPVASLLSVLAELLEFIRQAHTEGLLLQGLGPAAILIDRADRVHYIGSEMVAELKELSRSRRLFSPERYPRGFAAPECFELTRRPAPSADLYAWGTLAYFLFTGHMPWQIAMEQGQHWAQFQEPHFTRLDESLRHIPPAHVHAWGEQLGLPGAALVANWPGNLVAMLRLLLHVEPARRPRSADEVRAWMVALPPAPIQALLALDTGGGETRLYLDTQTLDAGMEIEVRRAMRNAPSQPGQGDLVYLGPHRPVLLDAQAPLTEEPFYYTVFSRKAVGGDAVYSGGVSAEAMEPVQEKLLKFAEAEAALATEERAPPRINLAFSALDPLGLAEILLRARLPAVRGWGLSRLATLMPSERAGQLVQGALSDPDEELRGAAAEIIWRGMPEKTDEALLHLVQDIGKGQLDDAIQAVRALQRAGVSEEQSQRIVERLEGDRPTTCPLCEIPLPRRERAEHLHREHGYIEVAGSMLPRKQAESRLWERVFGAGDEAAHRQLMELYGAAGNAYAQALHAQIRKRVDLGEAQQGPTQREIVWQRWEPWLRCLRQAPPSAALAPRLLASPEPGVQGVGRALILPPLAVRLRGGNPKAPDLRRALEEAAPGPALLDERIRLCAALPAFGVDPDLVSICNSILQEELPVACPECVVSVRAVELEAHLRRIHGIHQFRGQQQSYRDTRDFLLAAVCGPRPDIVAWQALVALAQDRYGTETDDKLVTWICHTIKGGGKERRTGSLASAAEVIVRAEAAIRLIDALLGDEVQSAWKNLARQLALEIVARLEEPLPPALLPSVKAYLAAKDIPGETRQNAVAGLVPAYVADVDAARGVLQAYISAMSKHRAVERLRELEQRIGQSPALDAAIDDLEDRVRMTCPRCQTQLERRDMVRHLWEKHRLILEGRQVREPWRILADWAVDYRLEKEPEVLARCRELAIRVDPVEGQSRLQRLLLQHGIDDDNAFDALMVRARANGHSLCPYCFADVPASVALPPLPLAGPDRLEGHGFVVRIEERGLAPRLLIDTPAGPLFNEKEPGASVTPLGAVLLLAGPIMLAAYGLLYWSLGATIPWWMLLLMALSMGLFLGGILYWVWPQRPLRPRLLDAAWHVLVPELLAEPLTDQAGAFLGSLAVASVDAPAPDEDVLQESLDAVHRHAPSETSLASLWRLQWQAAQERGEDPVPLVADHIAQMFAGKASIRVVGQALGGLKERWPKGRLLRLQTLAIVRAVEAGLDSADLTDMARVHPALVAVLIGGNQDHVERLRWFWVLRSRWPALLQKADSVFDLALDPGAEKTLADRPDLLLLPRQGPIHVGTRGVWLNDACIDEPPAQVDVVSTRYQHGEGFEIVADTKRFWFSTNPSALADELERWLHFYFVDFLPQIAKQQRPRAADVGRGWWRANAVACPGCHRHVVALAGNVGLRGPDAQAQLAS